MKFWDGYGSEHSMDLVMIGRFEDARDAARVKDLIARITERVNADVSAGVIGSTGSTERFSDSMIEFLCREKVYHVGPAELEQFAYDVSVTIEGNAIIVKTDECDISAFLKLLIDNQARVEVYSGHHYPESEADTNA